VAYAVGAWLIIQIAETIFPLFGYGDVPARIVVILLAIGFIPALVIAWLFQLTPDGLKKDREADSSQAVVTVNARKLDRAIIVVLVMAVIYFLYDEWIVEVQFETAADRSSIAILPFANRSNREEDAFFSDGIHDDLLSSLSKIGSLKVISRTSVMRYRDTEKPIPEIAEELGVGVILEGGIQRAGGQIRVNVQLIEAKSDAHLWAENYDRQLTTDSLFAIQNEITEKIVESLRIVLSNQESESLTKIPTHNLEAYNAYVLGRSEITSSRTPIALRRAEAHFSKALELDPDYALAWVGLADAIHLQVIYANRDEEESFPVVMEAVEKALELDPLLGDAYTSLASIEQMQGLKDTDQTEANYLKGIELSPNSAKAYHWLSTFYRDLDRMDEAVQMIQKAIEINPMDPTPKSALADFFWSMGRAGEAHAINLEGVKQNPQYTGYYENLARIESLNGNIAKAAQWNRAGIKLGLANPSDKSRECYLFLALGDDQSAEQCYIQLEEGFPSRYYNKQSLYYFRGQFDEVLDLTQRLVSDYPQARGQLAWAYLNVGDIAQARQILQELAPELYGNEAITIARDFWPLLQAAFAAQTLIAEGRIDRAHYLLDQGLETMKTMPFIGLFEYKGAMEVVYHAVRGENQKAIDAMRATIDAGWRTGWYQLRIGPILEDLMLEPGYIELITELEADIAKQRQWFENHKDERPF